MEGALPLGTIPMNSFPVMHFKMRPGDRITLISDGILEAMQPSGELFGFERITQLLTQSISASELADAAQQFGQEDDITVLTVARMAKTHLSTSLTEVPALDSSLLPQECTPPRTTGPAAISLSV